MKKAIKKLFTCWFTTKHCGNGKVESLSWDFAAGCYFCTKCNKTINYR